MGNKIPNHKYKYQTGDRLYLITLKLTKMKKTILSMIILISIGSYAQKTRLGFTTGLSIANYKSKVDGNNESGNAKAGFTAGVFVDVPVGKHFSFQPALNFVQKGAKENFTINNTTYKYSLNINYIEMPLNFMYNSNSKSGNFFIGAGPSLALAAGGKYKYKDDANSISEKIKFGSADDDFMKPLDLGANIVTGFTLNSGFMFSANYNAGLNNLFPNGSADGRLRSYYFGIKLGYLLKPGKKK